MVFKLSFCGTVQWIKVPISNLLSFNIGSLNVVWKHKMHHCFENYYLNIWIHDALNAYAHRLWDIYTQYKYTWRSQRLCTQNTSTNKLWLSGSLMNFNHTIFYLYTQYKVYMTLLTRMHTEYEYEHTQYKYTWRSQRLCTQIMSKNKVWFKWASRWGTSTIPYSIK